MMGQGTGSLVFASHLHRNGKSTKYSLLRNAQQLFLPESLSEDMYVGFLPLTSIPDDKGKKTSHKRIKRMQQAGERQGKQNSLSTSCQLA